MLRKTLRIVSLLSISVAMVPLSAHTQSAGEQPTPLGKMVDIGSYRLHLYCTGRGKQTVVLSTRRNGTRLSCRERLNARTTKNRQSQQQELAG
jgi:hypothetical protein